jgi:hypothetical protein
MGIDLLRGRPFTPEEAVTRNTSVIVSQAVVTRLWPDEDPTGQRIRRTGDTVQWFTVVGVFEDVKQNDWREAGEAVVYSPDGSDDVGGHGVARLRAQVAAGGEPGQ